MFCGRFAVKSCSETIVVPWGKEPIFITLPTIGKFEDFMVNSWSNVFV